MQGSCEGCNWRGNTYICAQCGRGAASPQRAAPAAEPPAYHPEQAHHGQDWEALLEAHHARYRAEGSAVVLRTCPPFRIVRAVKERGRSLLVGFHEQGPQDYEAVLPWGALALEAKRHQGARWPFADLPEHQALHLDAFEALRTARGARSWGLLLVHLPEVPGAWAVPWARLGPRWWAWYRAHRLVRGTRAADGSASLSAADLDALGVRWAPADGWLEAAAEAVRSV